jgi:polyisoprenoid-binding protein YceI
MVKKTAIAAIVLFALMGIANAQTWKVDPAHTSVGFTVRHMVVTKVNGQFTDFDGEINWDGKDLSKASVTFTVQSKSINTDNEKRDGHLRSADFFAVDSFPTLTFTSTKIVPGDGDKFTMTGNLTIRGVTKEVTFDCTFNGTVSAFGGERAGFSATTTINRQDFKVSWSKTLDSGGLVAGNDVIINLEVEAVKAQ